MNGRAIVSALVVAAVAGFAAIALVELREGAAGLGIAAAEAVESSGAAHPVTAVLLDFRAYDTWLELLVMLAAVTAVLGQRIPRAVPDYAADPLARRLVSLLVPLMVLTAGYLLIAGTSAPGGAFQAGALAAAALVLLHLGGREALSRLPEALTRTLLAAGAAAFASVAFALAAAGQPMLDWPPEHAPAIIVALEAAAAVSIGIVLALLVIAQLDGPAAPRDASRRS